MSSTRPPALVRLAALALLAGAPAAAQGFTGGRIPVTVVAGRLVASCDVSTAFRRLPVNLFIEYEGPFALQLHNKAAAGLRCENPDGTTVPITVHFPDFEITVPRREHGDEDVLDDFTKYHSKDLGENAVVGTLGAQVLRDYEVTFDLAAGYVELRPAPRKLAAPPAAAVEGGVATVQLSEASGLLWLPVRFGDGDPGALAVGCAHYDTRIDTLLADQRGQPAGDVGPLHLGPFDLTQFVALRPEDVVLVHPDGVVGVLGVNLLEHFRLRIDPTNRVATVAQTAPAEFPAADLAFFRARAQEDGDAMLAFLQEHAATRLGHEAAELLLELRLDEGADRDDCTSAVKWMYETTLEDLRTTRMLDLMKEMADQGHPQVVLAAGELGVASGRDDRYPNAVHNVHARMGRVQLDQGESLEAWRHLLSAAFGLPEDGRINLDLGRYYEQEGRYRRAFSRYVQAVIQPDSGPEALLALERVQPLLEDEDETFSVDLVERLIAGKVRNFGAATRFEASTDNPAERVVLCEFYTNAYLGDDSAGAIGGALGNEGLIGHFGSEHVAFLSYHLPDPQPDPMCTPLAAAMAGLRGVGVPAVHVVDGVVQAPGAARWRQAEAVYNRCRGSILERLARPTEFALALDAEVLDGVVSGELVVQGPQAARARVHLVLAEKGVLFPGKSTVVVHRMVARASLLEGLLGVAYEPQDGAMRVSFSRSLADVTAENLAHLDELQERGVGSTPRMSMNIDPRMVRVIAFVATPSGEVLQALSAEPEGAEGEAR
jgi:tetratricopeptide (TPR) repeat protein